MEPTIKDKIIESFTTPTFPLRLVIATIAYGMGIDIPDIRSIMHFGASEDVEMYVEAIGRAGRDSKQANALLFKMKRAKTHKQTNGEVLCK